MTASEHALVSSLAVANGQRVRGFVIVKGDERVAPPLIVVVVALVLIEFKVAVGSTVDFYFQIVPRLLRAVLHVGSERQDGTRLDIYRHDVDRAETLDRLAAGMRLVVPEVIPQRAFWQIDRRWRCGLADFGIDQMSAFQAVLPCVHRVCDRLDEQVAAEEILVVERCGMAVIGKVHDQRAHHRAAVERAVSSRTIGIGQQAVAQTDVFHDSVVAPVAGLAKTIELADHRRRAVVAHQRHEGSPFHPTCLQFLQGRIVGILLKLPIEETAEVGIPVGNAAE